jgi:hypothetical protein
MTNSCQQDGEAYVKLCLVTITTTRLEIPWLSGFETLVASAVWEIINCNPHAPGETEPLCAVNRITVGII